MLTAEQRYRQAMMLARIRARRSLADMLAGRAPIAESFVTFERQALIRELGRAYEAGRRDFSLDSPAHKEE